MPCVFLSLGSNKPSRRSYITLATEALAAEFPRNFRSSGIYKTKPFRNLKQSSYLNRCITFECNLSPDDLLKKTQSIEKNLGRLRCLEKEGPLK